MRNHWKDRAVKLDAKPSRGSWGFFGCMWISTILFFGYMMVYDILHGSFNRMLWAIGVVAIIYQTFQVAHKPYEWAVRKKVDMCGWG